MFLPSEHVLFSGCSVRFVQVLATNGLSIQTKVQFRNKYISEPLSDSFIVLFRILLSVVVVPNQACVDCASLNLGVKVVSLCLEYCCFLGLVRNFVVLCLVDSIGSVELIQVVPCGSLIGPPRGYQAHSMDLPPLPIKYGYGLVDSFTFS